MIVFIFIILFLMFYVILCVDWDMIYDEWQLKKAREWHHRFREMLIDLWRK